MALNWPTYTNQPNNDANAVGDAVNRMVDKEIASAAANQRALQAAKAAEAKRQRDESLAAARVVNVRVSR